MPTDGSLPAQGPNYEFPYEPRVIFGVEVRKRGLHHNDANFKSTALGQRRLGLLGLGGESRHHLCGEAL